jgi:hypothetical protein
MNAIRPQRDIGAERVVAELRRRCPSPASFFGGIVREAIDEMLDGPRTGRYRFAQLDKVEKAYIGIKLEILVRARLRLERGQLLDLRVGAEEVDVKWSMSSSWEIPIEAVDRLCLCIGGVADLTRFKVGLVRAETRFLSVSQNRDRKRKLNALGRTSMELLVPPTELPRNFLATLEEDEVERIMAGRSIQERVTALFSAHLRTPIPRDAVRTVARTEGDPIRRTRRDKSKRQEPLPGLEVLSTKYGRDVARELGLGDLPPDHFMAIPRSDLSRLAPAQRRRLSVATRSRLGL